MNRAHTYIDSLREGAPCRFDEARDALSEHLPLLSRLHETPQDPGWHAEGDVATHTRMVCEGFEQAVARGEVTLEPRDLFITRLATLLHDIAKPLTTTWRLMEGIERCVAPRHARRGADYLAYPLLECGLSTAEILDVMALVRHHHDPKHIVLDDRPAHAYIALARRCAPQPLWGLEMADMRGRRCADRRDQIELIELFRAGCEEYGVWAPEDPPHHTFMRALHEGLAARGLTADRLERALIEGVWAWERGEIYTPEEAVARSYALDERFCRVAYTFGPSGSGKSTAAQTHIPKDYAQISLDQLRAEIGSGPEDQSVNGKVIHTARERLRTHLGQQRDVLWDATNTRRDFRQPITQLGRDYKAHITMVVMHVPREEVFARNAARSRRVPRAAIARQFESLQWPTQDEAHRTVIVDASGEIVWDSREEWRRVVREV